MPNRQELFVNPEALRSYASEIRRLADILADILEQMANLVRNTETIFESESATQLREKFAQLYETMKLFWAYLLKVANYLEQNVAEPAEIVERVSSQNIAAIKKL